MNTYVILTLIGLTYLLLDEALSTLSNIRHSADQKMIEVLNAKIEAQGELIKSQEKLIKILSEKIMPSDI